MAVIGVAIAVPEPYGTLLREQRESFGDRQAQSIPTHITLVPPTRIADGDGGLGFIEDHLTAMAGRHQAFSVRLRGTGTFRPVSPVVFVAVAAGISECELLASDVRTGPLAMQLDFPYHPHVTVAHDVDELGLDRAFDTLATHECEFGVEDFGLYVHNGDEGWLRRRTFALGAMSR